MRHRPAKVSQAGPVRGRGWGASLGMGLLVLFSPVLLIAAWIVLVTTPIDVITGLREMLSNHDVVQLADGFDTAITIALLLVLLGGIGLALHFSVAVFAYGILLLIPAAAMLAIGAEYAEGALMTKRGYDYCTFHVTDNGRGEGGTYVYVRASQPQACDAVRRIFPPHQLVPGRRNGFDLSAE